jgi:hypothetical protein
MRFILPIVASILAISAAQAVDVPYIFSAGTVASSANVNADFAFLSGRITTLETAAASTSPVTISAPAPTYFHANSIVLASNPWPVAASIYNPVSFPVPGPTSMTLTIPVPTNGSSSVSVQPISTYSSTGQFVITGHNAWCPNGIQFSRNVVASFGTVSYTTTATAQILVQIDAANVATFSLTATTAPLQFTDSANKGNFTASANYSAVYSKATAETTAVLVTDINNLLSFVSVQ